MDSMHYLPVYNAIRVSERQWRQVVCSKAAKRIARGHGNLRSLALVHVELLKCIEWNVLVVEEKLCRCRTLVLADLNAHVGCCSVSA